MRTPLVLWLCTAALAELTVQVTQDAELPFKVKATKGNPLTVAHRR